MTPTDDTRATGDVHGIGDHADDPDCAHVLEQVHQFLDNELDTASGDAIRQHLAACEPCLDQFDVEAAVKALVSRCCGGDQAPSTLRSKVMVTIAEARIQYWR